MFPDKPWLYITRLEEGRHLVVTAPGHAHAIPECYSKKYHKMMSKHDENLLSNMSKDERACDKPGVILLVELDKLVGIAPYVIRETERLLYLEAMAVITIYSGRRHEMPLLGMLKHLSSLQQTSHVVMNVVNKCSKLGEQLINSSKNVGFQWFSELGTH